jgi:endonuclease YncB( thermonuclease family)
MKKLNLNLFSLLIIFFLSLTNLANSEEKFINFFKNAVIVTDGDTIKIDNEKIRLFGIDAPEMKQICKDKNNDPYACGHSSKAYLKGLINHTGYGDQIYCYYSERDKYKRIIGECFVDTKNKMNINYLMVRRGQAVAYIRYSEKYLEAQNQAKKDKVGIWEGTFDLPEEWRKKNK